MLEKSSKGMKVKRVFLSGRSETGMNFCVATEKKIRKIAAESAFTGDN